MDELVDLPARTLRALIGRKAVSPVELLDACIERIDRVNPHVIAIVALDVDRAREAARQAEQAVLDGDPLGPLHGLPVGIKDLTPTQGLRTTFGSLAHENNVPNADSLLVERVRAAGGIVLAKTNTPEFGLGPNTINRVYGATVNPFAPTLSCAGSSGGSAVALATGMLPLATGSDMGGSLRTPAAFCGVVGHRPSPGAVPSNTRPAGWSGLSVDGPMGRDVADTALLMAALVGRDDRDPLAQDQRPDDFLSLPRVDLSRLRVAFSEDLGCTPVSREVRACFRKAAERIAPLFRSAEWRDPPLGDVHFVFETLRGAGLVYTYGDLVERHRSILGPNVISNVEFGTQLRAVDIGKAQAAQTELFRRFQRFYDDVDLLITPSASAVPFPVEELAVNEIDGEPMRTYFTWIAITYAITLTTHPATAIPCGLGPTGLPFGLQIVGRNRDDRGTLAAAAAIEAALADDPFYKRPTPDLNALMKSDSSLAGRIPAVLEAHA